MTPATASQAAEIIQLLQGIRSYMFWGFLLAAAAIIISRTR